MIVDVRSERQGAAGQQRCGQGAVAAIPVHGPAVPVVGRRVRPCGQRLAQARGAVAGTDVAVAADGVGELDEPAVLLGDLKADQSPRWPGGRSASLMCSAISSLPICFGGSVFAVQLEPGAGASAGSPPIFCVALGAPSSGRPPDGRGLGEQFDQAAAGGELLP